MYDVLLCDYIPHSDNTTYFGGHFSTNEHYLISIRNLTARWHKPAQRRWENLQPAVSSLNLHTHIQAHSRCVSAVLCQPFWISCPIDNSPAYLHSHHTDVWMTEGKRAGGRWELRGEMGRRERNLMRRLEDVPDLRCLFGGNKEREAWRGLRVHDSTVCVCVRDKHVHTNVYMCVYGWCLILQSIYLSLFLIGLWLKMMHLKISSHPCESAASLMDSVYPCVTSGGLPLFPGSDGGATEWMIWRIYGRLVQLTTGLHKMNRREE